MIKVAAFALLIAGCAAPADLPEDVKDADGVGGATAKIEFVKWLGQVILQAVTNITINVKVDHGSSNSWNSDKSGTK